MGFGPLPLLRRLGRGIGYRVGAGCDVDRLTFQGRQLTISTYAEPGARGRFEQFLVSPAG